MTGKSIFFGWLKIVFGLVVFSLGVHLTIRANLGLAPWDCLGMGISYHTPLNYGLSMTAMGIIILIVDILLKERSLKSLDEKKPKTKKEEPAPEVKPAEEAKKEK